MPDFIVSTAFTSKDKVSGTFKAMGKNADKFGSSADRAFNKASKSASRFGDITKGILAAGAVQKGLGLMQQGVASVASEFVSFDTAITGASAKFKDLDVTTKEGQKTLLALKQTARDTGATTAFSATEAAQGLDFLAMAGFNTEQAMASLSGVVDLAIVANTDLATATDIASDSLGAFGLMTQDSAQLQTNLTRINDVMAKTMTSSNTTLDQLFEAAKKGGPAFTSAGQSVESFNTLLGIMANSGVKGEEAGTQLRNVILRLADPTNAAQIALDKLGVTTQDSSGNFRDVVDILADFETGLKGMGNQQRAAALSTIFGARAITGVNILLQEGTKNLRGFRGQLESSIGSSAEMSKIMQQSLGNRLKSLQSALIEVGFQFFTAFETQGASAIETITNAIRTIDLTPLIDGVKNAITFFSTLFNIIKPFLPVIALLIQFFLIYTVVMKTLLGLQAAKAFLIFANATRKAAIAQGLLNTVMNANPMFLIATAIALTILLVIKLIKNWDKVKAVFVSVVEAIGAGVNQMWDWFMGMLDNPFFAAISAIFLPFITIPALIIKHWTPIKEFFSGIFDKMSALGGFIGKFLGFGDDEDIAEIPVQAPNKTEIESRQQIGFQGNIQIAGAPEGTTIESKTTGAPPVNMELVGVNL